MKFVEQGMKYAKFCFAYEIDFAVSDREGFLHATLAL
jgi:hypothetical protein